MPPGLNGRRQKMKMLIAGKIKKTEMGSIQASFKIAELCK
jgi:hypothetical protein